MDIIQPAQDSKKDMYLGIKVNHIYRVDDANPPSEVFTSLLATQTGKVIDNLTLGDESIYYIENNDFPISIHNVNPGEKFQSGVYSGFLYIDNGSLTSVPINLFTEPKTFQAVSLVVIGVLASILFWEVFFVLREIALRKESMTLLEYADRLVANPPKGLTAKTSGELIKDLMLRADHQLSRAIETEYRYLTMGSKIVSAEVATVAFGILTGLVGLANNSFVTNLVEIDWNDGAILFRIGLGIGSLKGIVDH
jgi:hypothetical protein